MTIMPHNADKKPKRVEIPRIDLLNHLADMAAELRTLAQTAEAEVLAIMFDLAHREALRQASTNHNGRA